MFRHVNMAQSLDGYLWAVSSLKEEKMRIRCLEDSHLEDIKPPLTIVHIGNGCEGYSSNLFIPAKSELTSEDETLTRHVFFLDFNNEYQDLTKYSLIQQLNLPQLTAKELEDLCKRGRWYKSDQHKFMSIKSICRYSSTWCHREKSWSRHQKLQEDWLGTKDEIGYFNSSHLYLLFLSLNCKRCPSTSLYELRCV